ncbi:hypothetical protein THAOC_03235 [Thalassiosira oceanica]|uniref:Uncharacterized protein n=1 Tax=Thalassiosira oceanica TaxID=159749 RepID=K0TPX4_THAOC|nr:hypothetical protein THAOC_03235 [Thalassiosira oceanica]|eukprot:EJK75052.1 hypothetical protein THAOC_03235 [Thalassiosira oceanica]
MPATFRRPFPHTTELTGYRRQRLDDQRPHPHGHYRSERDFYRVAASHQGFCGGYWTGEAVDRHDLVRLEPSQLQQNGLGLCLGDQIGVLYEGRWVAGFVGVIGDPFDAWSTMLSASTEVLEVNGEVLKVTGPPISSDLSPLVPSPSIRERTYGPDADGTYSNWKQFSYPPPDAPFIDITVSVADGQGMTGDRLELREFLADPRKWRDNFCCSFYVVRLYQPEWDTFLREIDGATVVINRETKEVLRRLSTSPSQQEAFLQRMPVQRRYPEESVGRNYGRSGHRDGLYGSRSQREPSRNRWSASRMPSDGSCRQEAPRFTFSGGTFRGCPVGPNYKPASKSQKPVVELKSASKSETAVESEPMVELKPVVKSKPAVVSEPVVESKPAVASTPALASKPVVKSKPAVAPTSVVNPKSADGPVSSFLKFVQSLADPTPAAAVPKPAVKSPSVVQSTPAVKSKSAVSPKPAALRSPVQSKSNIDSTSLVAPTPVVELPPRPAAAPDQQDAIGFAEGWTSRTSRARREPSPTSDNLHSLAVAECVKKYVKVQPRHKPRPRPRRLRATSHASKKDGDQFHAARQTSLPVGTTARRQFDGRSLDRRDERCRGKSGRPPTTRPPSATFMASDDEVFFNADDGQAYCWGALSMDPKLVDSFLHSSLTLVADPVVESVVTPVSVPTTPRVRKPLSITKPSSVTSPTATPVVPAPVSADDIGDVQPPSSELVIHSSEGVDAVAAQVVPAPERVATENRVPEGAVDSTVDPTSAASTKAAVTTSSRRASKAPAIVSEGACADQGTMAVNPRAAISRFFIESLRLPPWMSK